MKVFLVFILTETLFASTSYSSDFFLLLCKLCKSINYSLHFERVLIHKHSLYCKEFSTDIYRIFCSTVWCFVSYICWSVSCISWVGKFSNFFRTLTETETRFIFEVFNIAPYGKFISISLILFLLFLSGV